MIKPCHLAGDRQAQTSAPGQAHTPRHFPTFEAKQTGLGGSSGRPPDAIPDMRHTPRYWYHFEIRVPSLSGVSGAKHADVKIRIAAPRPPFLMRARAYTPDT
jgi:hypothetical protein